MKVIKYCFLSICLFTLTAANAFTTVNIAQTNNLASANTATASYGISLTQREQAGFVNWQNQKQKLENIQKLKPYVDKLETIFSKYTFDSTNGTLIPRADLNLSREQVDVDTGVLTNVIYGSTNQLGYSDWCQCDGANKCPVNVDPFSSHKCSPCKGHECY